MLTEPMRPNKKIPKEAPNILQVIKWKQT
jgi:hypothetical protein